MLRVTVAHGYDAARQVFKKKANTNGPLTIQAKMKVAKKHIWKKECSTNP